MKKDTVIDEKIKEHEAAIRDLKKQQRQAYSPYQTLTEPYISEDNKLWPLIPQLLYDHSAGQHIIFATDSYEGHEFSEQMTEDVVKELLLSMKLKPRRFKTAAEQKERTKQKAEVFTPSWICKQMIDMCEPPKEWKALVNSTWLEITCGEAPYLVSRFNAVTGEPRELSKRMSILDRKLRAVNENAPDEQWFDWVKQAYKTTYGYEWQGDNLFIARINLLETFYDFYEDKQHCMPSDEQVNEILEIIVWNIWQMDGLKDMIPLTEIPAKIRDWTAPEDEQIIEFRRLKPEKEEKPKKGSAK